MQSDELDNKLRDAAEHHHPAYDEKAWEKMEKLLDEHLPVKKDDRRRIAFILIFLLFLGTAAYLFMYKPWKGTSATPDNKIASPAAGPKTDKPQPASIETSTTTTASTPQQPGSEKNITADKNNPTKENMQQVQSTAVDNVKKPGEAEIISGTNKNNLNPRISTNTVAFPNKKNKTATIPDAYTNKVNRDKPVAGVSKPDQATDKNVIGSTTAVDDKPVVKDKKDEATTATINTSIENNSPLKPELLLKGNSTDSSANKITPVSSTVAKAATSAKNDKKGKTRSSSFFLTVSAGPDVSSTGLDNLGKVKPVIGAGVGFTWNKKNTIRTGIYTSRKIYNASPYAYHPPDYFWQYYPDLQKIQADCRVIEVPISYSYSFRNSDKRSWFASAGLSSYFMKRETYNYIFKNSTGQIQNWKATIRNANKHFFSVLTLSAGYEKKVNKNLSLMAEPYLKIPLIGVGYGKVKLAGAGVLFTVAVHPFEKSKPK